MGMNAPAMILANSFTKQTADEFGAVKGAPCTVGDTHFDADGNTIVEMLWTNSQGQTETTEMMIQRGLKGEKGEPFKFEDFTQEQLNSLKGEPGESGTASGTFTVEGIEDYEINVPEGIPEEYRTSGEGYNEGRRLDITSDEFFDLFYNGYVGKRPDGYTVTKKSLGKDQSGLYDIYEYDFKPKNWNRLINLSSGMHTYELTASFGLGYFIRTMMEDHESNSLLGYLYRNVRIKIIPIINPWGWNQTPYKKYGNVNGVNLNRNFDYNGAWEAYQGNTTEWNVKGSAPFSEAETKILKQWMYDNASTEFWIDCHNGYDHRTNDIWTHSLSTSPLYERLGKAHVVLESWWREYYKAEPRRNYVYDSDDSIKTKWCEGECGIPQLVIEQSGKNSFFDGVNNSAAGITNYAVMIFVYLAEFLRKEGKEYSITDYLFYLQQQLLIMKKIGSTNNSNDKTEDEEDGPIVNPPEEPEEPDNPSSGDETDEPSDEEDATLTNCYLAAMSGSTGEAYSSNTRLLTDFIQIESDENISVQNSKSFPYIIRVFDEEKAFITGSSNLAAWPDSNTWGATSGSIKDNWIVVNDTTLKKPSGLIEKRVRYIRFLMKKTDGSEFTTSDIEGLALTVEGKKYSLQLAEMNI